MDKLHYFSPSLEHFHYEKLFASVITNVWWKVATVLISLGILYCIENVIYKVTVHPLAKYPGPFLAKFTNGYSAYHSWKRDLHLDMWRCHLKYGDMVRYGPNRLLVNTPAGLKDIYSMNKNVQKSEAYQIMIHRAPNTLTLCDKKEHARRRKLMSQGFSDAALRTYSLTIQKHVQNFCDQLIVQGNDELDLECPCLRKRWSPARNLAQWSNYLAFDMITDIVFGLQYNLVSQPTNRFVIDTIERSNQRTAVLLYYPELTFRGLDKRVFPVAIKARNILIKFISKVVEKRFRAATTSKTKDVFSILAAAKDPDTGRGLSMADLGAESTTLIIAGSDTTSTALSATFFYLSRYPEAYRKAFDEVRSIFAEGEEVCLGPKLNSCTYLRACIDEAMRITPPVGGSLFRMVNSGGAEINGDFVPAGVDVGVGIYSLHHNPAIFPEPTVYRPERFYKQDADASRTELDRVLSAYNPFSIGSRGCIGKSLAIVELMITMATVINRFDFRMDEGMGKHIGEGIEGAEFGRTIENEFQLYDGGLTSAKDGPLLQFRTR